jgi:hypothetical protein
MNTTHIRSDDLPACFFEMMPREAVRAAYFPQGIPHNSIWDMHRTPEGRFFVSLCAEGLVSASAELHEYFPAEGRFSRCFRAAEVCRVGPRAIPPSKIHTSIDVMNDGRLIMATHTTAPAPGHPAWMIEGYYTHQWEGYAGSHLLVYDPGNGQVTNLGIPAPRESIYGGCYDPRHHAYYMSGYLRGHLYRYDCRSQEITDFGQMSECSTFRLARGPDGHIYTSTTSGWVLKIDVDQRRIIDLNYQFPGPPGLLDRKQFTFAATGPDGRFYMAHNISDRLVALDTKTGKFEDMGSVDPCPPGPKTFPRNVAGMAFDDEGRLWYGLASAVNGIQGTWVHLAEWDLKSGGRPHVHGLLGTAERTVYYSGDMIQAGNTLYLSDTNHGPDAPGMLVIDLALVKAKSGQAREISRDPHAYVYLDDRLTCTPLPLAAERLKPYVEDIEKTDETNRFMAGNQAAIQAETIQVIRLWRLLEPEKSGVTALRWLDGATLAGDCTWPHSFIIREGQVEITDRIAPTEVEAEPIPAVLKGLTLPHRPGRQHRAALSCWAEWNGGRYLVGTLDGLLAIVNGSSGTVYSLGAVGVHGPIRALTTDPSRSKAYGVAGDQSDLGLCFYYDDVQGVRELGRALAGPTRPCGLACSCVLSAIALSPDGTCLAIGAADRLGTVYLYRGIGGKPKDSR